MTFHRVRVTHNKYRHLSKRQKRGDAWKKSDLNTCVLIENWSECDFPAPSPSVQLLPSCAFSTSLIPHSFLPSNLPLSPKIASCITASCSSFLFSDTCTMEESQTNTSCVCECACETERGICKGGG